MPSPLKALCGALIAVLLAASPAFAEQSTVDDPAAFVDPVRVMPLGDSITQGGSIGGYRLDLGTKLRAAGRTVDFVGSLADGPGSMPDRNHEGHPGWTIAQVDANVVNWLRTYTPRTILLHIGTNDMYGSDPAGAPRRLSALVDKITAQAPGATVFVSTIIPIRFADSTVRGYNAAIVPLLRAKAAAGKKVHVVDMYPAVPISDLPDGIHPNAAGYAKMATVWFNALSSVPGSIGDPPAPGGTCTATSSVTGTWNGGFQAEVTVANPAASPITGWTVKFTLPNGHTVSQIWGGAASGSVTVTNAPYNGSISPGASATFGFLASGPGAAAVGTATCAGA
ncbi:cellulose binding domain-containing protein [Lentzea californiensis]|uniref:cellulose binding domain-containing protein n=1 Tax=Lentzea californiensis TaxID=438851 RepID=UPI0021650569|nr:cellulose binding domain-containing protein [Lentzea californiensis]MCR3751964.1 GDSL-like Lipase/Acylhydrolase family protein [Lentzea californiensis]